MQRREFIGLAGSAAAWPVVARARQPNRMPVVGVLWHGTREKELANPYYHWVVQGFEDVGLKPGINIHLDHQFADESDARYRVLAPQMAALKPDVLLAIALPPTLALKKVHGDVPLVFLGSLDPLASGVVDSLAKRPEAITGITSMGYDLSSKRLQILKDVVPALSRVALVVNPKTRPPTENDIQKYGEAAKLLDVSVRVFDVDDYDKVAAAFAAITDWGGGRSDNLTNPPLCSCQGGVRTCCPLFAVADDDVVRHFRLLGSAHVIQLITSGNVFSGRGIGETDSRGRTGWRYSCAPAHKIRAGSQHEDGQSAWADDRSSVSCDC